MAQAWLVVLGVFLAVVTSVAVEFAKIRMQEDRAIHLLRSLVQSPITISHEVVVSDEQPSII